MIAEKKKDEFTKAQTMIPIDWSRNCKKEDRQEYEELQDIIDNQRIIAVYQPIVSLVTGEIYGYEALSRIDKQTCSFNVEEMFGVAEKNKCLWRLEYVCRKKALKGIKNKLNGKKLFLNVDPYVIYDEKFQAGMTREYLERYKIKPENIVFEITERTNIEDAVTFVDAMKHYRKQKYELAIDDFGNGYAGIKRVYHLQPQFIKIDMSIVRNVHLDAVKSSMIEGVVKMAHDIGIHIVAEGIETKEEMEKLISLGVEYGQGYYLAKPKKELPVIAKEIVDEIKKNNRNNERESYTPSLFGDVGSICRRKDVTTLDAPARNVYEYMESNPEMTEICVLDGDENVCGLLTKQYMMECFSGRYGYNLYSRKKVENLLTEQYTAVESNVSIEMVAKMALMRPQENLYDAVVVTQNGKYCGVVTVKDLLQAAITIQVERATDVNPLTHLPGNHAIQERIEYALSRKESFTIMYLDLDNFKAYNDAYGFENGDLMIKAVASSMREACCKDEFMGHVGGDDFVIISNHHDMKAVFEQVVDNFKNYLPQLYSEQDFKNQKIFSKNRDGQPEVFPLASLSAAVICNEHVPFDGTDDFSKKIAKTKKKSKKVKGFSYVEYQNE